MGEEGSVRAGRMAPKVEAAGPVLVTVAVAVAVVVTVAVTVAVVVTAAVAAAAVAVAAEAGRGIWNPVMTQFKTRRKVSTEVVVSGE